MEAPFRPREDVREAELGRAGGGFADELAEVALAGDEAHDRRRPVGRLRLDELRELLRLALDEVDVPRVRCEPEDELVEEEDDGIVAQVARVSAEDRESVVERQVALLLAIDDLAERREDSRDEHLDELRAKVALRRRRERLLEPLGAPSRRRRRRAHTRWRLARGKHREENLIAHSLAEPTRILEERFAPIDAERGRIDDVPARPRRRGQGRPTRDRSRQSGGR